MSKESIIYGLAGLVIGIFVAPLFGPVMPTMWGNRMMGGNQVVSQIDAHFIEQMIPHHADAITMANLGLTRAEHYQVRSLSDNIIKAQMGEINQMKEWYRDWFGKEVPDVYSSMGGGHGMNMMVHGGMMGTVGDLRNLETTKPFDEAFIKEMIPHHQMAVMMAQMLLASTNRPEMKKLAQDIITAQTKEIKEMRQWYSDWY